VRAFYEAFWADMPQDPVPWAWERRRALLLSEARKGDRVLDLGCGAGRFLGALREAGADVRLLEPDGSLPLGHGEVDLVWCSEVLEHVADTAHALLESRRVLRPGGRLLVTVPYHGRAQAAVIALVRFEAHYDPLGQHLRFYTRRSLAGALAAAGFTDPRVRLSGGAPAWRRMLVARAGRP
jgi:ubiquinone/menaquinone biosynthesis C-methylase UbiE